MKFFLLFLTSLLVEVVFIRSLVKPGFVAPDLVLLVLLLKAYSKGREAVLWAIAGGAFLDLASDNVGLNMFLETFFTYVFVLVNEKVLLRNFTTFLVLASGVLLLKKISAVALVSFKFSFDISSGVVFLSWLLETLVLLAIFLLYFRRRE